MTIPVANVYHLLLYAWKHVQQRGMVEVSGLPTTELRDLLGHVLAEEVGVLISRGLGREYVTRSSEIAGVRGKLDFGRTLKHGSLINARTYCEFDELEHDVLRNRIIKATLRSLLGLKELSSAVREKARRVYGKLDAVSTMRLERRHFEMVQSHRNVREYGFVLQLCRLLMDSLIPGEGGRGTRFRDFREDDARMGQLFEDFVLEFYRLRAPEYSVRRYLIRWHEAHGTLADLAHLPVMRTDVVLESPERRMIIDTKYYKQAMRERFGQERVNAAHLYQIFTYLENQSARKPSRVYEGVLLYPVVEKPFSLSYRLKGHSISVRSIDLSQQWERIEADLLALVH